MFAWDAHNAALAASELKLGLEEPVYEAEAAKVEACRSVDAQVTRYIDRFGRVTFAEQLGADLSRLVAYGFPVVWVDNCARAHRTYKREYVALRERLEALDIKANAFKATWHNRCYSTGPKTSM